MNENNHDTVEIKTPGSPWRRFLARFVAEPEPSIAHRLYERLVQHARLPLYYGTLGVPDTPEGRFEILSLHVGLTVQRLYRLDGDDPQGKGRELGQALFDLMVADVDMNLRELGVGDLSVGKQVKRLAGQFYARLAVLNEAFNDGRLDQLSPMLSTNVWGSSPPGPDKVAHLAKIVAALKNALAQQTLDDLEQGRTALPDEPVLAALLSEDDPVEDDGQQK
ncbi:MAG: ubiquinol-cytochrome C chaperone family protein [Pseudomonadota bacterium]